MSEVLQEFLIPVHFKVDQASEARMRDSIRTATLQSNLLADAIEGSIKAFGQIMRKVAENLDQMFYASQRTAASVENIKAFGYAASQLGSSIGEANSALETFGKFLRSNPGSYNLLERMGITTKENGKVRDTGRILEDLGEKLAKMPRYMQQQYANLFGISDKVLFAITSPEFKRRAEERRVILRQMGFDEDKAAESSKNFAQALGRIQMVLAAIATKVEAAIVDRFGDSLKSLGDFLIRHGDEIANTITEIAATVGKMVTKFLEGVTGTDNLDDAFSKILKTIRAMAEWVNKLIDRIERLIDIINKFGRDTGITSWLGWFMGFKPHELEGGASGGPGAGGSGGAGGGSGKDSWYWRLDRWGRKKLGLPPAENDPGRGAHTGDAARRGRSSYGNGAAPQPEAAGKYRPVYKLTDRDLSDAVVNTIAGEASYKRPGAVDAVINNMLNRVGSKGWGPSRDIHDVARAPGQYAGYKRASAEEAAYIRSRIRAIASGGVPDNTGGSNAYRASWYRGPWMRKWGVNGVNVGGNVFAFEPSVKNGPYAAYPTPREGGGGSGFIGSAYAAPARPRPGASPFGGLPGQDAFRRPLDGGVNQSWNRSTINNLSMKTDIKVDGAADPATTAALIGSRVDVNHRNFADRLRNFQGAAQ